MTMFAIKDIQPNPFRNIDHYPINKEKVKALRESLRSTGFWDNVIARLRNGKPEIAYGHHRLAAMKEEFSPTHKVDLIIKDLDDQTMIRIMANENMEEWKHAAETIMETVRTVVNAYADGLIELPAVGQKTSQNQLRYAPSFIMGDAPDAIGRMGTPRPYTAESLASFLEWREPNGRPRQKLVDAMMALELIEEEILEDNDFADLTIFQARAVVEQARASLRRRETTAQVHEKQAEAAKTPKQAEKVRQKAQSVREEGRKQARAVGKAVSRGLKEEKIGYRSAAKVRYDVDKPQKKPIWIDDFTERFMKYVSSFLDSEKDKKRVEQLDELIKNRRHMSDRPRANLIKVFRVVARRLDNYAGKLEEEQRNPKQLKE